ncbi:MAG: hypothetical protein ACTSPV_00590 [Candidatus Hodarchaeales archaeon]
MVEKSTAYKGNRYTSYSSAIQEIDRKYRGVADWGVLQTGIIIDLRAAFIIGEGINIIKKEKDAEREFDWTQRFLEYNDLDGEVAQEFAKEAEIEGKIALKLALEEDEEAIKDEDRYIVSVRFISWLDKRYIVETNPQDYLDYLKLSWKPKNKDKDEVLNVNQFVYKKFGGRVYSPNEAKPKIMPCLTQIENLDRALRDWREINHIFGGPILYGKCETEQEVNKMLDSFQDKNFKIKRVTAGTGDLKFITLDTSNIESIEKEIVTNAKLISGNTGIPIHFLGFPELMSNRATAENLMEMIIAATTKERETWIGAYEEIIKKAMKMYNNALYLGMSKAKQLNPDKIRVNIPIITKDHYERIEKIFLPACIAGKISDEAFLEQIPGMDVDMELERKQNKENSEFERIKRENEDLRKEKEFPFMGEEG